MISSKIVRHMVPLDTMKLDKYLHIKKCAIISYKSLSNIGLFILTLVHRISFFEPALLIDTL